MFLAAVLVCIFVAADFRSGYAKNLFAVRSKKSDYIISKSLVGFVGGSLMIVGFILYDDTYADTIGFYHYECYFMSGWRSSI